SAARGSRLQVQLCLTSGQARAESALRSRQQDPTMSQSREKLLQVALELFAHKGFHAIGLDAIIDRAGVSKQTFYNHFESKDDLARATLERRRERKRGLFARLFDALAGSDPRQRLYAHIDVIQAWFRHPEWRGCICIRGASESPPPAEPAHQFA